MKIGDRLFRTTPRTFHLKRCLECHTLFMDPMPSPAELERYYPPAYWWKNEATRLNRLEDFYRRTVLRNHVAVANRVCDPKKTRLLDVGCGGGSFLKEMKRRVVKATGFDFSIEAAAHARRHSGVEVRAAENLGSAGFTPGSFDVITLFHVLEHVPAPYKFLEDVSRLLHPLGCLIVQVPNIQCWQARLFGQRWYGLDVPRHVVNYSGRSLETLLQACGYRIQRLRHFNLRDNAPSLASSAARTLDPAARQVRGGESSAVAALKHALYGGLVALSYPFAVAESAAGAGATIMAVAYRSEQGGK